MNTVETIVECYGGMVDKQIGDNVMAVFGAPRAHDDDCDRALRAATDILRRLAERRHGPSPDLNVHIGIAGGKETAGSRGWDRHSAYTITGETANAAARLAKRAHAGEILITDTVYRIQSRRRRNTGLPWA